MGTRISTNRLTARYSIHQFLSFSIAAGISTFATTYLLEKGFSTSQIGTILSTSSVLACLIQPLMGDVVDRLERFMLPQIIGTIFLGIFVCFSVILFCNLPKGILGTLYGIGIFLYSTTSSLNNSLCAYYANRNYPINYGVGNGVGSMSFSFASLIYGYIMAGLGVDSMIWIALILMLLLIVVVSKYPHLSKLKQEKEELRQVADERVSIVRFFGKYKLFTCTMLGVMLVGMCHSMSENYFIKIFQAVGGGSEHVGIGMFVACFSAVPYFLFFEKFKRKFNILTPLKIAGLFFMLKTILLIFSTEIWHIYLIQLLQTFTYGFLYQPLYYFTKQRISEKDLVKGQAVTVSLYTIGTATGTFVGGRAIDLLGLKWMLWFAFGAAFVGTVIINVSLKMYSLQNKRA